MTEQRKREIVNKAVEIIKERYPDRFDLTHLQWTLDNINRGVVYTTIHTVLIKLDDDERLRDPRNDLTAELTGRIREKTIPYPL